MKNETLSVKLYRHKVYKDLYLIRTNLRGGNKKSPFYEITKDLQKAINSVLDYNNQKMKHLKNGWIGLKTRTE